MPRDGLGERVGATTGTGLAAYRFPTEQEFDMPNANAPAGPGKPLHEREDAVAEQEGIAELDSERAGASSDPGPGARQAERDAHANDDGAGGAGRRRSGRSG